MKKLTAISILSLIILSQWGYYCFYSFQLYEVKKEAKTRMLQNIPEKFLNVVNVQERADAIVWEDNNTEFKLDGKMYDVVRFKKEQGKVFVVCISDEKEDGIIASFANSVKKNADDNSGNSNSGKTPIKISIKDWAFEEKLIEPASAIILKTEKRNIDYSEQAIDGYSKIVSPPPNINI